MSDDVAKDAGPLAESRGSAGNLDTVMVELNGVSVVFRQRGLLGKPTDFHALIDIDLELRAGETIGLVGESGSGKTALGRALLGLIPIETGSIRVAGTDIASLHRPLPKSFRKHVQVVFQDPLQALNPRHRVERIIGEPLAIHTELDGNERHCRVVNLLESVGLSEQYLRRRTSELSGGQRQRVAIARALAPDPDVLVLDEAVSALDVTTTAQILRMLRAVRRPGTSMLFIAHDLALVRGMCDRVAVMYRGRIVEIGDTDAVCGDPRHPYTQLLVSSIPHPHPTTQAQRRRKRIQARVGDGAATTGGCPFLPRCQRADDRCTTFPDFVEDGERSTACHAAHDEPHRG